MVCSAQILLQHALFDTRTHIRALTLIHLSGCTGSDSVRSKLACVQDNVTPHVYMLDVAASSGTTE